MSASWLRAAGSLFYFSRRSNSIRTYATEPPRTFLPTSQSIPEASSTAQSRLYYATHPPARDLPKEESKWPVFLAAAVAGVAGWSAFMMVATNQEKLSSSVFRSIVRALKVDPQITETLGDAIRPQAEWYLNGDPHIKGHIGQLQGNIDVSFRIKGSKGTGTVYFTSIRKEKGVPFTVLRFKVICDNGTILNIVDSIPNEST